jgi:hypothetical protein
MNAKGFGPAAIDRFYKVEIQADRLWGYMAIVGREQLLIDRFGGAQSWGGTSGNTINAVDPGTDFYRAAMTAAIIQFGLN